MCRVLLRCEKSFFRYYADDQVHAQEFKDMAHADAQKDLNKARDKLETMFSEKETRDDKIKELEVVAKELASAVETATARAESLQANLFASISREAILRAQVGDQQNSLGARITYLERSRDDYVAQEVARAVRVAIAKYRG
ncbi:unnamed protein product [Brassica oleracea var. botrytis]|uniref:(rape) hypothetical protein n=1 Tax=Brassica napus TaxID=3708 RepID=A0A816RWB8_BRANA|nr:unnamed protein product [Brassica napus]